MIKTVRLTSGEFAMITPCLNTASLQVLNFFKRQVTDMLTPEQLSECVKLLKQILLHNI